MRQGTFDPQALLDAIDAERRRRGLTWAQFAEDTGISTTTVRSMPKRTWGIELDGVIGLARFLGRTVESFAGCDGGPPPRAATYASSRRVLRFDKKALHAAVDAERERRGMTWNQVAADIWPRGPWGAKQLRDMARGGRGEVYSVLAICGWLGQPIQAFVRESLW